VMGRNGSAKAPFSKVAGPGHPPVTRYRWLVRYRGQICWSSIRAAGPYRLSCFQYPN